MKYVTSQGRAIETSEHGRLGSGGEGQVLPVLGAPHLVAKIFHRPDWERQAKLQSMLANPPPIENQHPWVAWPAEILFLDGKQPTFAGYLMPKVVNAHPIFMWYNLG